METQAKKRHSTRARIIEHDGKRLKVSEWAKELGVSVYVLRARLCRMEPAQALVRELPPRERSTAQDAVITVRVSKAQHAALKSAAHHAETSLNQFCVNAVLAATTVPALIGPE
jgi:uncharacterized protein (DUF2132 family)